MPLNGNLLLKATPRTRTRTHLRAEGVRPVESGPNVLAFVSLANQTSQDKVDVRLTVERGKLSSQTLAQCLRLLVVVTASTGVAIVVVEEVQVVRRPEQETRIRRRQRQDEDDEREANHRSYKHQRNRGSPNSSAFYASSQRDRFSSGRKFDEKIPEFCDYYQIRTQRLPVTRIAH